MNSENALQKGLLAAGFAAEKHSAQRRKGRAAESDINRLDLMPGLLVYSLFVAAGDQALAVDWPAGGSPTTRGRTARRRMQPHFLPEARLRCRSAIVTALMTAALPAALNS